MLLAVSTVLATRPSATQSQVRAKLIMVSTPNTPSQASGPAGDRKPISSATRNTTTLIIKDCRTPPTTWEVSTDGRKIAIVRNRAMMPSVMSIAAEIATPWEAAATPITRMPGTT